VPDAAWYGASEAQVVQETQRRASRPDVSVIVPTRDSAVDLDQCLVSLRGDQGASFEVIVVDQESSDATRDIAAAAGAKVLVEPRPKLYAPPTQSRNAGAAAASGEYLLHLDADMAIAPAMLSEAVHMCRNGGYSALTLEEIDVAHGFWAECKALERRTYRGSDLLEAARFVRADVFRDVGGYDESLGSGEDWDVHARYAERGAIGRLPGAVYHYLGALAFADQVRKKFTYGRSAVRFLGKRDSSSFPSAMAAAYARSWRLYVRDPSHTLGFVALRFAEAVALASGVGVEWIGQRCTYHPRKAADS
jgi:glycosyltransferase involved in cell wall biosynthesis